RASFLDGHGVARTDVGPDLLLLRITGDRPKRLGAGRLYPDPMPAQFWIGLGIAFAPPFELGDAFVGHFAGHELILWANDTATDLGSKTGQHPDNEAYKLRCHRRKFNAGFSGL